MTIQSPVVANGRTYSVPSVCAIAICLDGCEPAYLEVAISEGLMPNLQRMRETGTDRLAHSVIPSFTNPNNPANPDATTGAVAVKEAPGQGLLLLTASRCGFPPVALRNLAKSCAGAMASDPGIARSIVL